MQQGPRDITGFEESHQLLFLFELLKSLDARRAAIDIRSSVVLASASFALGLLFSQVKAGDFFYPGDSLSTKVMLGFLIVTLLGSAFMSLQLIAPIPRPMHKRLDGNNRSLSWFWLIANEDRQSYNDLIRSLNSEAVLDELSAQVVEISRILRERYSRLAATCRLLYSSLALLLIYALIQLFSAEVKLP